VTPPGSHRRTQDSVWRDRDLFIVGHDAIVAFLRGIWERELDYVLRKSPWAFNDDRIAARFSTNGMTVPATGFVATATNCRSSAPTV